MKKRYLFLIGILLTAGCATPTGSSSTSETDLSSESSSSLLESNESLLESSESSEEISSEASSEESSSSEVINPMPDAVKEYYSSVDFSKTGHDLIVELDKLLDKTSNNTFTYKSMFNVFIYSDVDPNDSSKILSFYSGNSATQSQMNREHTWPNSRGGNYVENDPHVIRPTITAENSARGNDFFNEGRSFDPGTFNNLKYRGIAARIIFYAAVKGQDSGLYLVDSVDDPRTSSGWNKSMGKLSTLLKWNLEYDIDETEITRNEVLYKQFNHCRNPFIDNRDLACQIYGNTNAETLQVCGSK